MIKLIPICGVAIGLALGGCASGYGYGGGGYGVAAVGYDGYYDGYYGPFDNGYWGADGYFYFRDKGHRKWRRDDGRHFRKDAYQGYHHVQGRADAEHNRSGRPRRHH